MMLNQQLSLREVVELAKEGQPPDNWRIYRGKDNLLGIGCAGLVALTSGIIALVIASQPAMASGSQVGLLITMIVFAVLPLIGVIGLSVTHAYRSRAMMILTFDTVAACDESGKVSGFFLENVARIEVKPRVNVTGFNGYISARTSYSLDVYNKQGIYFKWPLGDYVEDSEYIGKNIISAYYHYVQNQQVS